MRLWPNVQVGLAIAVFVMVVSLGGVDAGQSKVRLIMVEAPGCYHCARFMREVGRGYPKSREGQFAPLRRVGRSHPSIKGFNPIVYTPTFIVVRSGEEIGRISGYPGKAYFYPELRPLLSQVGFF